MNGAKRELDQLFSGAREIAEKLEAAQVKAEGEIEKIRQHYKNEIETLHEETISADRQIRELLKEKKSELFGKEERIDLGNGSAMRLISNNVKQARGVLKKLEELSYKDVIEISKRVKWSEIEKWPDEKLSKIGTSRIRKERFSYEIRRLR